MSRVARVDIAADEDFLEDLEDKGLVFKSGQKPTFLQGEDFDPGDKDYLSIAKAYSAEVLKDRRHRQFGQYEWLACRRWRDDFKKPKTKTFTFSEEWAVKACRFIEKLPHVKGTWESKNITLEPWQIFMLCNLFGWRKKSNGTRRFSRLYLEIGRKNAKSTIAGGIALFCLACEDEVGPEIIVGATTGAQAKKVFEPMKMMVRKAPFLAAEHSIIPWSYRIECQLNDGEVFCINAKSSTQDGHNPHVVVLDELHAHKDRGLFDVMRSSMGSRRNPLFLQITTAGYSTTGVCYEQRTLSNKILTREIEADHFFCMIFTIDQDDLKKHREFDESIWRKANPNLGTSVSLEEMRAYALEAKSSPDSLYEFLTKRLNVWSTARGAWLNGVELQNCPGDKGPLSRTATTYGGLDLASTTDITSFAVVQERKGIVRCKAWHWVPEDLVTEATEKRNIPYQTWVDQGWLLTTPGNVTDYDYIQEKIEDLAAFYSLENTAYDPWNAVQLVSKLSASGVEMVEFRQGVMSYNASMKDIGRRVKSGQIDLGRNPVLLWMFGNVVARYDVNDNMAPDRKASEGKIDGFVAVAMANALRVNEIKGEGPSVYSTRGVLTL